MRDSRWKRISASMSRSEAGRWRRFFQRERRRANISALLCFRAGFRAKSGADGGGQAVPALCLFAEFAAARGGEAIELGAAVVVGGAPFGVEEALMLEFGERGIEGALLGAE